MKPLPIIIIADNIRSLYNVGSLFRLADGLAIEAIYLCGLTSFPKLKNDPRPSWVADRADREIQKTGLAGVDHMPFRNFATTDQAIQELRRQGYSIIGLELTNASVDYRSIEYQFPLAVVIGHETDGVDDSTLKQCDHTVHLPMRGTGKSLNVSTATAALLYYLHDQWEEL